MKNKHVYIFGDEEAGLFHGFTHDKQLAKDIKKYRKRFKCYKIKNDEKFNARTSINDEFVRYDDSAILTCNEEEYFIESFGQFQQDVSYYIKELNKDYKYFKWTDEELPVIKHLMEYLISYANFITEDQYKDDYADFDVNDLYNIPKAVKWFIENTLDGTSDDE